MLRRTGNCEAQLPTAMTESPTRSSPFKGTARDETVAEGRKSETQVRSGRDGNCPRMLDALRAAKRTSFPSQLQSKVEPPRSPVEDLAVPGNRCVPVWKMQNLKSRGNYLRRVRISTSFRMA